MKSINRDIVRQYAHALITLNGSTTTLDIKRSLRQRDFWVKQEDVRNLMLDITSKDGDISYTDTNGMFREYKFAEISRNDLDSTMMPVVSTLVDGSSNTTKTHHSSSDDIPATYEVTHRWNISSGIRRYVGVSRSKAKHLWSKETGFQYRFARTCKISA
jgi:hypothetical protein